NDAIERGTWWEIFRDPALDDLERQLAAANQSLAQAAANYEQIRQIARADHATFFPTLSGSASAQRSKSSGGRAGATSNGAGGSGTSGGATNTSYSASLGASWAPDFWGRIRRLTEADVAAAQASAANLAAARLSLQAALAQTYFQLRIADERTR